MPFIGTPMVPFAHPRGCFLLRPALKASQDAYSLPPVGRSRKHSAYVPVLLVEATSRLGCFGSWGHHENGSWAKSTPRGGVIKKGADSTIKTLHTRTSFKRPYLHHHTGPVRPFLEARRLRHNRVPPRTGTTLLSQDLLR